MNLYNQNHVRSGCTTRRGSASSSASTPAQCLSKFSKTYLLTCLSVKFDPTPATMLREWGGVEF